MSFLHVVFGEMVPKNLSFSVPDRAVLLLAPPLVFVARVFRPIIVALNATANGVLRLFGVEPKNEATSVFTLDEVATIVAQSTARGRAHRLDAARSAPRSSSRRRRCRTSRSAWRRSSPCPRTRRPPTSSGPSPSAASRATCSSTTTGEPTGYLHLKDVIDLDEDEFNEPVPPKRIRQLISIFRGTDLEDALATMRRSGVHVARAFDENGATTGVLFLEDIIEELVGEVQDATRRR